MRERHGTALDVGAQRLALEQLHRDEGLALVLAEIVDGDHVRAVELGHDLRLALEARPIVVAGARAVDHLQRDLAAERLLNGDVDLAHATAPERALDAVLPPDDAPRLHRCEGSARCGPLEALAP